MNYKRLYNHTMERLVESRHLGLTVADSGAQCCDRSCREKRRRLLLKTCAHFSSVGMFSAHVCSPVHSDFLLMLPASLSSQQFIVKKDEKEKELPSWKCPGHSSAASLPFFFHDYFEC